MVGRSSVNGDLIVLFHAGKKSMVVDISTGTPVEYPLPWTVHDAVFNASSTRIVAAIEQSVKVIDWAKGEAMYSIPMPGPVNEVKLHPDGQHIITVNGNRTVYILRLPEAV